MYNRKILILGGTGYIGSAFKAYDNNIICFSKLQYNSEHIEDNINLVNFIRLDNITHVIDLTRNTSKQLITFYNLMRIFPNDVVYITLSSYSIKDNSIYGDDHDNIIDTFVTSSINNYLKTHIKKYYSFITPQITNNDDVRVVDLYAIKSNYTYYCTKETFIDYVFNIIETNNYGIYIVPAKKFICK